DLANRLRALGAGVIVSCDKTSPPGFAADAVAAGFLLAYSSSGINDKPPSGTVVTFPVHRVGRVREVVDSPSVCPKALADFLDDSRPKADCQQFCHRCHNPESEC